MTTPAGRGNSDRLATGAEVGSDEDWTPVSPRESRVILNPGSWHNRSGEILRNLDANVWVVERGYTFLGADVGGKTTIFRLPDGRLFIHSPLPLNAPLKAAINSIGMVSAVVSGNVHHVDFIAHWKKHFPDAQYIGPPGSISKCADVPFTAELSMDNTPHESFGDEEGSIRQCFVDCVPFLNEVFFCHIPSKTLVASDLITAFPSENVTFKGKILKGYAKHVSKRVFKTFLIKDKARFEECMRSVEEWDFRRIVPCHGEIITENAKGLFKAYWDR